MATTHTHRDCANFAPIDVTKGICHLTKDIVQADAGQCADFALLPRCANCREFAATPGASHMGHCNASAHEPKFFAYPDMVAVTCDGYAAR